MGLDVYNAYQGGGATGSYSSGSSGGIDCASLRAQIQADQNYLAANSGSGVDHAIQAAINQNISIYNGNCLGCGAPV